MHNMIIRLKIGKEDKLSTGQELDLPSDGSPLDALKQESGKMKTSVSLDKGSLGASRMEV